MKLSPKRALLWADHQDEILNLMREDPTSQQWSDWLRAPLEHAAARGNGSLVTALLKMGANGSSEGPRGCGGRTLLDAAVEGGNADVVNTLLRAGSGPDVHVDAARRSPLHASICGGHLSAAKALLAAGADANFFDRQDRCPPLHAAVSRGYEDLVTHLLIGGADPNAPAVPQWEGTALHMAVEIGNEKIVSALLCNPNTNKNSVDFCRRTPLMLACEKGLVSVVDIFLAGGADVHFRRAPHDYSALERAADEGHRDIISAIMQHAPDVDCHANMSERTPLHTAGAANQGGSVDALLDHGFDVNGRDLLRRTPLHKAARHASLKSLLALLRRGADVNARDTNRRTALHYACIHKTKGVGTTVDVLLRWGACETLVNQVGRSPADILQDEVDPSQNGLCSEDELERVRALLARAPADRAWRRRCWLVMLRARVKRTEISCVADGSSGVSDERDSCSRLKVGRTGKGGGRRKHGEGSHVGEDSEANRVTGNFGSVVTALIGLRPEGVFRAVLGFV
ncbi:unnamed protein product [Scytosiphon promiscuus]